MRVLRALLGALLWILAAVVGLLGVLLSVTVILLPLGIPLLMLARRLFTRSVALVLPRKVSHPVDETGKSVGRRAETASSSLAAATPDLEGARKAGRKVTRKARKAARRKVRKRKSLLDRLADAV